MPVSYRIVADKAEELPEELRTQAKAGADGKLVVEQLPDGWAVENIAGLRNTVQNLRGEAKQNAALARAVQEAGITAEELKDAAEALGLKKAGKLTSSEQFEAFKKAAADKAAAETAKLTEKLTKRTERLRNELVRGKLAPIVAAKGGSKAMDAILALAERNIRVEEDAEGNLVPVVVGNDGKAALTKKSGSMDPMGFDELVDQMREADGTKGLFEVRAAGGAGTSSQSAGRGATGNQGIGKQMSGRELLQRANESTAPRG